MSITLPFLSSYDPPGTSEGTLDPLGLYQIADQLAVRLVPAVRERMQRIRFLTAIAVGAMVTEGMDTDPRHPDSAPYLVWEWLVVEALVRAMGEYQALPGVPGTDVTRRALRERDYLDARSYLKTPRVFGFNGVYKRLATHLGLVDVHLAPGPHAEGLVDAWARGLGLKGLDDARSLLLGWSTAVRRSLYDKPPRTRPGWSNTSWVQLANAFAPSTIKAREKRYLRDLLHAADDRQLGALPAIWQLLPEFQGDGFREELLHDRLEKSEPEYGGLLAAIRGYEAFARSLQDGFDVLKAEAARPDAQGFQISTIARNKDFRTSVGDLNKRFEAAHRTLGELNLVSVSLQNLFDQRFQAFGEPMDAASCAAALCVHHESVQRAKSADGKRPWFDRIGPDRIYIRHQYRAQPRDVMPGSYVHDYRGFPIRRFYTDLQ